MGAAHKVAAVQGLDKVLSCRVQGLAFIIDGILGFEALRHLGGKEGVGSTNSGPPTLRLLAWSHRPAPCSSLQST